ncbi:MAG: branched-chain amino acid aminotransferase [Bacteroidota bacterium]
MKYNINIQKVDKSRLSEVDFNNLAFGRVFSDHMFVVDYEDGEWINPSIVPFDKFPIHPAAMALHYGQAIFEGMKASKSVNGEPLLYRPEKHAERINASARRMSMAEIPADLFLEALHLLVGLDQAWIPPQEGSALYLRPFMFANDEFIGVRPSQRYKFIIFTCPVGPYYPKPVSLLAETTYVRAAVGGTGEAKAAGNYAGALLPAKLAQEKGYDQVMWLDANEFKYIQEVGTMNIFFVIGDKIITPNTDGAILKGINRANAIHLLKHRGYDVEERPISIDEVVEAHKAGTLKEAFGTGTAAVVAHVSKIAYKDYEFELPPLEERKIGEMIKSTVNGWRAGTIEDEFGWIVPVKALEVAH